MPVALRRRYPKFDGDEYMVACCKEDNWRKATRRLAPPSWADRLGELPGTKPWVVWSGGKTPDLIA